MGLASLPPPKHFHGADPRPAPGRWHRDTSSATYSVPPPSTSDITIKAFLYVHDTAPDQGPNAVLRGSHRIPWAPDGVYDLFGAGYSGFAGSGLGYAVSDGFCPLEALPNKVVFAASAGDIILFDIVRAMQSPPLAARGMTVFSIKT